MKKLGIALLLSLAACSSPPAPADNAADNSANAANEAVFVPPPGPQLGGVDLDQPIRAMGSEPFWTLDVAPGDMTFTDYSVSTPAPEPFLSVSPKISGDTATYTTSHGKGAPAVLTLTAKKCLDVGEEDNSQPLTAELRLGDRVLHGCAGPKPKDDADMAPSDGADNGVGNSD